MTAITSAVIGKPPVPVSSVETPCPRAIEALRAQLEEAMKRIEDLERTVKTKEEKYDNLLEHTVKLEAEGAVLTEQNSRLTAKVDGFRAARESAERQRAEAVKLREQWKGEYTKLKDASDREVSVLKSSVKGYAQARKELETSQKTIEELTRELQHLQTAYSNKESLLTTRSVELRAAQVFLNKSDTVSHGDVQRMLEHLNAQIFQLAALVTDRTAFCDARLKYSELEGTYGKTERWLGLPIANLLYLSSHAEDPTWAQTGLQAITVELAAWIISAWDVSMDDLLNSLLTSIHKNIFERGKCLIEQDTQLRLTSSPLQEPQAISAHWRVLSRRYAKQLTVPTDIVADATAHLLDCLHGVLRLSGARGVGNSRAWGAAYADRARDIVVQCMAIQKAIGEDVASSDFQLICPSANVAFDAASMQDVDDCSRV
ncbi:uncharacterized protein PHACADRAFT_32061 [Phanerochaete carnosa HHB-10118-sp]|uniref:Uncharacterized protein n=1 Tax=Phanerochaete carnosa (strain HHB-10118-sp) TaxID=650164 RepID=K5VIB8_PHACS|nr:uncharacterized protein PHACADRAFT_32061 [Phanerochaete carnosa HHB-10118-sp]EKM51018.1 hypothetical protein PHACADRAFT_32061 [Phanerochaete carnosa HHB-10118-sp]